MNTGLQTRSTMVTWLFFKVKRRFFSPNPWSHLLMSTSNIRKSLSLPHRQTDWFWHFGIGWDDMATASLIGLALPTNNPCLPQCYPSVRCLLDLKYILHLYLLVFGMRMPSYFTEGTQDRCGYFSLTFFCSYESVF